MEKIALAYSKERFAGQNIADRIREIGVPKWATFYEFEEGVCWLDLNKCKEDKVIVLSTHASAAGTKSLTTHSIGNYSKAELGGQDKTLVYSMAKIQTNYLRSLAQRNKKEDFTVCYEVTHHGPYSEKEICFIEIGSSEEEWKDEEQGRVIAETVIENTFKENNDKSVIGIGGGHYAPDFTKLALRKNYSFGHICPQYALEALDSNLVEQMISKTGAEEIILDWKGLKSWKQKVVSLCEESGLPFERVRRLLKN
jgi:D-aminoacyl-tRNA deacylase